MTAASQRIVQVRFKSMHKLQRKVYDHPARYKVIACGRQWGKTTLTEIWLASGALQGEAVAYMAPNYKMTDQTWRGLKTLLVDVIKEKSETSKRLTLVTGGIIELWSLENPDGPRGRRYKRVAIDEAAFLASDRIWYASIQPTLIALGGSALFTSTPFGQNWFYKMWKLGMEGRDPEYASFHFPTKSNPYIPPEEVDKAKRRLPEKIFSQEYEAAFIDDAGMVFRHIAECALATPQEEAIPGHQYYIGADFAKSEDFSVFTVVDATIREVVKQEVDNRSDYMHQLGNLTALCNRFKPIALIAEKNAMGDVIIDQLRAQGINVVAFQTTAVSKALLVQNLAFAFDGGPDQIKILNDPDLITELQAFEPTLLSSGLVRYAAPEGMHDDRVMSLLLAWHGMTDDSGTQIGYMRFNR